MNDIFFSLLFLSLSISCIINCSEKDLTHSVIQFNNNDDKKQDEGLATPCNSPVKKVCPKAPKGLIKKKASRDFYNQLQNEKI